ncbi:shikimate dehydrogenase family protein [Marisediminicola senii]|uniref:shikimate dehydrogenase family protein n=1 Tax=Marisediminicola senii TaxID=2711233 RepID=UPI0013ED3EDC|nr:shikimate dehydrogenase [Marisediminicola senii]
MTPADDGGGTRLAVLGSPIAHSQSPALHAAAYGVLGLPWTYEAIEVRQPDLGAFVRSVAVDPAWRGLSLTMPLKRDILPMLDTRDEPTGLTGGANTVLLDDGRLRGFNTDVYGVTAALREAGIDGLRSVEILGAGATAASVLAAVHALGATGLLLRARDAGRARPVVELARRLGMTVTVLAPREPGEAGFAADLVVSTLPGGADMPAAPSTANPASTPLLDVAYSPWPTAVAAYWLAGGGRVIGGLEMLVNQALGQVRAFTFGDPWMPLADEPAVLRAMRASIGLDPEAARVV